MHSTPPTSIKPPDDKAVVELISPDRLNPYLTACTGDTAAALALYRWNSDLAAAFFEPLGHLEIMLRNALDARLVARQQRRGRTAEWYVDTAVPLSGNARSDIAQARQRAGRNTPVVPRGKIIAELSFGFWRFLLARQYRANLWPDLAGAFPHAPNRALPTVEDPVKRLHKFRNRIAHHEGIWHLPLEARRDDIQTVLGFIAPAAAAWVVDASRINDVLARRP
ncbi:Abi family protein [Streptomyces chlorus]|uniref:Abi-like protein n=1 Tax=Streptomyces chlorus TaxID=887452 RepID=A0ABW1EBU0_9ACTN